MGTIIGYTLLGSFIGFIIAALFNSIFPDIAILWPLGAILGLIIGILRVVHLKNIENETSEKNKNLERIKRERAYKMQNTDFFKFAIKDDENYAKAQLLSELKNDITEATIKNFTRDSYYAMAISGFVPSKFYHKSHSEMCKYCSNNGYQSLSTDEYNMFFDALHQTHGYHLQDPLHSIPKEIVIDSSCFAGYLREIIENRFKEIENLQSKKTSIF